MKIINLIRVIQRCLAIYCFAFALEGIAGPGQSKMAAEEPSPIITIIGEVTLPNGNIIQARTIKKLNLSQSQEYHAAAYGVPITPPIYDIIEFNHESKKIIRRYILRHPVESIGLNGGDEIRLTNKAILSINALFDSKKKIEK